MSEQTWSDLGIDVPSGAQRGNIKVQCPNCSAQVSGQMPEHQSR
jgi:hypothetical protein